jgi:hypothetical protein
MRRGLTFPLCRGEYNSKLNGYHKHSTQGAASVAEMVLLRQEESHMSTSASTHSCAGANLLLLNTACNLSGELVTCPEYINRVFGQQHRDSAVAMRGVRHEHLSKHT